MKTKIKKYILSALLLTFAFTSCDKNEEAIKGTEAKLTIQNMDGILQFEDQKAFDIAIDSLNKMTTDEQNKFLSIIGFKSYKSIYNDIENELELMVQNSTTKTEFDIKYQSYVIKYQSQFLFNNIKTDFISPISKLKNNTISLLVNGNGEYIIGNNVLKAEMYSDVDEYSNSNKNLEIITNSQHIGLRKTVISNQPNYGYVKTSDRKAIIELSISSTQLIAQLTAQYKTWLGYWKSGPTYFYIQYDINKPYFRQGTGAELLPNTQIMYSTPDQYSSVIVSLGYIVYGTDLTNIRGNFLLWTQGIAQSEGVQGTISFN